MKFRSLNLSLLGSLEAQQKLFRSLSCGSIDGIFGMMEPGETDCAYLGYAARSPPPSLRRPSGGARALTRQR